MLVYQSSQPVFNLCLLLLTGSPDPILCNASESTNQRVTLFCSWPGGNPTADVTLEFQNDTQTLKNSVNRTVPKASVTLNNNILSCNGTQNGHLASCELPVGEKPLIANKLLVY